VQLVARISPWLRGYAFILRFRLGWPAWQLCNARWGFSARARHGPSHARALACARGGPNSRFFGAGSLVPAGHYRTASFGRPFFCFAGPFPLAV